MESVPSLVDHDEDGTVHTLCTAWEVGEWVVILEDVVIHVVTTCCEYDSTGTYDFLGVLDEDT